MHLAAIQASKNDVDRAHILNFNQPSALLQELFTTSGSGILVTAQKIDYLRSATMDDINAIMSLIIPLQEQGILATAQSHSGRTSN